MVNGSNLEQTWTTFPTPRGKHRYNDNKNKTGIYYVYRLGKV